MRALIAPLLAVEFTVAVIVALATSVVVPAAPILIEFAARAVVPPVAVKDLELWTAKSVVNSCGQTYRR